MACEIIQNKDEIVIKVNEKDLSNMKIKDYLKEEMKRLNRINDKLEENKLYDNEPEQIKNNVLAMCEIANILNEY